MYQNYFVTVVTIAMYQKRIFDFALFTCHSTLKKLHMTSGTASANSANSVEADHGCTSRFHFNNAGDNVTLALRHRNHVNKITSVIEAKKWL